MAVQRMTVQDIRKLAGFCTPERNSQLKAACARGNGDTIAKGLVRLDEKQTNATINLFFNRTIIADIREKNGCENSTDKKELGLAKSLLALSEAEEDVFKNIRTLVREFQVEKGKWREMLLEPCYAALIAPACRLALDEKELEGKTPAEVIKTRMRLVKTIEEVCDTLHYFKNRFPTEAGMLIIAAKSMERAAAYPELDRPKLAQDIKNSCKALREMAFEIEKALKAGMKLDDIIVQVGWGLVQDGEGNPIHAIKDKKREVKERLDEMPSEIPKLISTGIIGRVAGCGDPAKLEAMEGLLKTPEELRK